MVRFLTLSVRLFISAMLTPFFLVIPVITLLGRITGTVVIPFEFVLWNNILFLIHVSGRLGKYFYRAQKDIRYGPRSSHFTKSSTVTASLDSVRQQLQEIGYRFNELGSYAEKKEVGYWGAVLIYSGLLIALAFGSYDYVSEFAGTVRLGKGHPLILSDAESYIAYTEGPFASASDLKMKLQVIDQAFASEQWPKGYTEIVILSPEERELQRGRVAPGKPLVFDSYEFRMDGLVVDAWIIILTEEQHEMFSRWISLVRQDKEGTYYGSASYDLNDITVEAWYKTAPRTLRLKVQREGVEVGDVILGPFSPDHMKKTDGYVIKHEGIGTWTDISVMRRRHVGARFLGAGLLVLGIALRLMIRPKRVWLKQEGESTVIRSSDRRIVDKLV